MFPDRSGHGHWHCVPDLRVLRQFSEVDTFERVTSTAQAARSSLALELVPIGKSLQPGPLPYRQGARLLEMHVVVRQRSRRYRRPRWAPILREYALGELFRRLELAAPNHGLEFFDYLGMVLAVIVLGDRGTLACHARAIGRSPEPALCFARCLVWILGRAAPVFITRIN